MLVISTNSLLKTFATLLSEDGTSHTPLVAMSSGLPQPDLFCKIKANISSFKLKTLNNKVKACTLYIVLAASKM